MLQKTSFTGKRFKTVNERPIIGKVCPSKNANDIFQTAGVLTQELDSMLSSKLPPGHNYTSYLAASYVQWVQSGGARVVPVIVGRDKEYYAEVLGFPIGSV